MQRPLRVAPRAGHQAVEQPVPLATLFSQLSRQTGVIPIAKALIVRSAGAPSTHAGERQCQNKPQIQQVKAAL